MLKALEDLGKPDHRYMPGSPLDPMIGQGIEDLHGLMRPFELLPSVPEEVRWQFDTARSYMAAAPEPAAGASAARG